MGLVGLVEFDDHFKWKYGFLWSKGIPWAPAIWWSQLFDYPQLFDDPQPFDDPQLFNDQLKVWHLIIQKSMWYLDLRWSCFSLFNLEDLLNWGNGGLNFNFLQIEHAWLWMNFEFILKKRSVISWRISRKWIAGNLLSSPLRALGLLLHMGPEGFRNRKKHPSFLLMPNFHKLQEDSKNVSLKIGSWKPQKLFQIFKNAYYKISRSKRPKYP